MARPTQRAPMLCAEILERRVHASSDMRRHRNARANALTIALSMRGRGE